MKLKYSFIILLFLAAQPSIGGEYHVDKARDNLVKFISDAPIEDFEGVTKHIDGYLYWEESDTLGSSRLYFEVDLNTVDTGVGLRNRHMREDYLETDKYPTTYFKGKLNKFDRTNSDSILVKAEGVMFIHGIENQKSIDATLIPDDNGFKISSKFSIALPDYEIEVPQLMFLKISEKIDLELEFYVKLIK